MANPSRGPSSATLFYRDPIATQIAGWRRAFGFELNALVTDGRAG